MTGLLLRHDQPRAQAVESAIVHSTAACHGVPSTAGPTAAEDITREFAEHRPWHQNVRCTWDGTRLMLHAENDFDPIGLTLSDEFSDCISAYIVKLFDGEIKLESVEEGPMDTK